MHPALPLSALSFACACASTPGAPSASQAAYAAELAGCTANATSRAEDDVCRSAVEEKYKALWLDSGVTP